ncbi:GNAT family N-acetyltransferase [Anaerobacillus alkalilacustris]|uniref:GNAT family N-acetyltransferase n=1 Tax=Anaerobacillus alkalilacustris TaxID=393763 RepID=A0A1S2LPW4_9BACI|nr:GNAT family N-acetyltransferase [Anaerobacillus alkalilacustris]OIJ13445.1 GNAT family N-acetyltransferase [Anaerobacillus alkalilacustris]
MLYFETKRLLLRPFVIEDALVVQSLATNIDLAKTTLHIPYPYPDGLAQQWITIINEKMKKGSSYTFAIVLKGSLEVVGCVMLNIALNHNRGELAYWIGKPYWDNGYATEASKCIIKFAFKDLHLNRIWACVMKKNKPSIGVMRKVGLRHEGTFPQHVLKWGVYEDVAYYGIVKEQYEAKNSKNETTKT